MKSRTRYAVLAIITIGILVAVVMTVSSSQLYSAEKDSSFSTLFHKNPAAQREQSLNSSLDIEPSLQEIVDFAEPISLNIRIHNFEDARRDLERFAKSRALLKNLIVRLDMKESEIQDLEKNTALQKQILDSLLNTSISLEELQSMEIQYYSESNREMLVPFRLRGDELRKRVQGLNFRYRNATEKVAAASKKLGVSTTKNDQSADNVDKIVSEISRPEIKNTERTDPPGPSSGNARGASSSDSTPNSNQKNTGLASDATNRSPDSSGLPGSALPATRQNTDPTSRLSLILQPDTGRYEDQIEYSGISLTTDGDASPRTENNPVVLYMDERPFVNAVTDPYGFYSVKVPIGDNQSGTHIVYAQSPTARSASRVLTVIPVNASIVFRATDPNAAGNVTVGGRVTANNHPVKNAPVTISWDQSRTITTSTDNEGYFMEVIPMTPGSHTLTAEYKGSGDSITHAESNPVTVEISLLTGIMQEKENLAFMIAIIMITIVLSGGAVLYMHRRIQSRSGSQVPSANKTGKNSDETMHSPESSQAKETMIHPVLESGNEHVLPEKNLLRRHPGLQTASWAASRGVYYQLTERISFPFWSLKDRASSQDRIMKKKLEGNSPDHLSPGREFRKYDYESFFSYYQRILAESGIKSASRAVQQQIAAVIAHDFSVSPVKSLTAREVARHCHGRSYCRAYSQFITIYERVRYGGAVADKDLEVFETSVVSLDEKISKSKEKKGKE